MITNNQAVKFATSIGWDTDSHGFLIKKSDSGDSSITIRFTDNDNLQERVIYEAKKFDSDKFAIDLWERHEGRLSIEDCMQIAQMFESDLIVLSRWLVRREYMIKRFF